MLILVPALALVNITVSAGYYSLPQLARAISTPTNKITCDPILGNRLALVRLENEPPSEVASILSQTFGVKFVAKTPSESIIVPDPDRQREEAALKSQLIKYYTDKITKVWDRTSVLMAQIAGQSAEDSRDSLVKIITEGKADALPAKFLLAVQDGLIDSITYRWMEEGFNLASLFLDDLVQIGNEYDLEAVVAPTNGKHLSILGTVQPAVNALPLPETGKSELLKKIATELVFVERISFDPVSGQIASRRSMNFRPNAGTGGTSTSVVTPDVIDIRYPRLSDLYTAVKISGYDERSKKSSESLTQNRFGTATPLPSGSICVSERLLRWAKTQNQDVVMEVSICRDLSPRKAAGSARLADEFATQTSALLPTPDAEGDLVPPLSTMVQGRVRQIRKESSYTLSEVDGALCVRDEFAFLDHSYPFPATAVSDYANDCEQTSNKTNSLTPTFQALTKFVRQTTSVQDGLLSRLDTALLPRQITAVYPLLKLLLRQKLLEKATEEKEAGNPLTFDLQGLSNGDIDDLANDLASLSRASDFAQPNQAFASAVCQNPNLREYLSTGTLKITRDRSDGGIKLALSVSVPKVYVVPDFNSGSADPFSPPIPAQVSLFGKFSLDVGSPESHGFSHSSTN